MMRFILRLPLMLQRELQEGAGGCLGVERGNVLTLPPGRSAQQIRRAVGQIVARTDKEQVGIPTLNSTRHYEQKKAEMVKN